MWVTSADHQLAMGVQVEMEHAGTIEWLVKRIGGEQSAEEMTALIQEMATRIAQDHLKELPDYYTRLKQVEG